MTEERYAGAADTREGINDKQLAVTAGHAVESRELHVVDVAADMGGGRRVVMVLLWRKLMMIK